MRNLIIYLLLLFDLAVYGQTTQVTISRYAIPSAGATVTINEGYFPNLINITTNGVTALAGNSYTMTYNSLPLIGSQWDVYLDVHHLTYGNANQITIFGRQPLVENPNTDTIYMHFTVLYDSTGSNAILDMKYVSQAVQLQTLFGNLTVTGNLSVGGNEAVTGIAKFNDSIEYRGAPNVSGSSTRNSVLALSQTDSTVATTCALLCTDSGEFWNVHGNTGLTNANFLGTTDTNSLRIFVNNAPSGGVWYNLQNTGLGVYALSNNTTGADNTGIGSQSLLSNTTGSLNAALGISSLHSNTTGGNNTGIGNDALYTNATGSYNVAVGSNADVISSAISSATIVGSNSTAASYGNVLGANLTAGNNQTVIGGRSLYLPGMTTGLNYGLFDTCGCDVFTPQPIFQNASNAFDSAQTSAQTITSYTPPKNGTYSISPTMEIISVTTDSIGVQVTFTDETGASQTLNFWPMGQNGPHLGTAQYYSFSPMIIRASNAAISVITTLTTSGGSIKYNCGASIKYLGY